MYLSKAIALGIIATLPLALGFPFLKRFPFLETRQNGVTCQTSSGSPLTDDVTAAINQLSGKPGNCPQTNGHASDCSTLVHAGHAAISVCGGVDTKSSAISCADAAGFANQIQQTCLNGQPGNPKTKTGGMYTISPSKRVEVIDTSSV